MTVAEWRRSRLDERRRDLQPKSMASVPRSPAAMDYHSPPPGNEATAKVRPRKSRRDEKKTALSSSRPMTGKFVACLASKAQPECQPIKTDSAPGVDQHKESVVMPPFDIDAELYKLVHSSDSDIDIVFALLIVLLLRKIISNHEF
ncbi:unnamed protein product [Miscanthus lutarioriparius]|uniref:Uncharacterized protein n=1 Tax=Miscanthus lutarioriparius TaxID=422564 RepID=A0A811N530_9POAL|nr:unnamed protein product [Miscanthus lutarioriparius]